MKRVQRIGLFGFGVVGEALYNVLNSSKTVKAEIVKVCIKNEHKQRNAPAGLFTTHPSDILNDQSIDVIVELTDDAPAAYEFVQQAIKKGIPVVTANKSLVAGHLQELIGLQEEFSTPLLYEGACCASIPIIRNLEEYYDHDMLRSVSGIVNGSTNYILTQMQEQQLSYKEALLLARQKGFAESNPALDVEGHDAANKLAILLAHAFGVLQKRENLLYSGITSLTPFDFEYAAQRNTKIKLVANIFSMPDNELAAFVLPQFVKQNEELFSVNNEFNGLITESTFADKHFFKGRGAGGNPTAAAVLSDISALSYRYKYEYKKLNQSNNYQLSKNYYLNIYAGSTTRELLGTLPFEWIDESHRNKDYLTVSGTIHASHILNNEGIKKGEISIIATSNPLATDVSYKKISGRSLALAGVM